MRPTITLGGREAVTIGLAAHRRARSRGTTQRAIHRAVAAGALAPIPTDQLDGWDPRMPLYWADEVSAALDTRPGRGANLRRDIDG